MDQVTLWLIVIIISLVAEVGTTALVTVWFAGGGLAAVIAASLGAPFWVQVILFVVVSVVLVVLFRSYIKGIMTKNKQNRKGNVDRLIGRTAIVTDDINNLENRGRAKLDDVSWEVRTANEELLHEGDIVRVISISGNKLVVEPVKISTEEGK